MENPSLSSDPNATADPGLIPNAEAILREANEAEDLREKRRAQMLHEIAKVRWGLVQPGSGPHRLDNGEPMDFKKWAFQIESFQAEVPEMTIVGSTGMAKAQPVDAKVLTPNGWMRMGDIGVGTVVSTPDGKSARVIWVARQGVKDIYKITFRDGRSTEACGDHLWKVHCSTWFRKSIKTKDHPRCARYRVMTTHQIIERLPLLKKRMMVDLVEPVDRSDSRLPIDPYFLGILLGDGSITDRYIRFSTADKELVDAVNDACPKGWEFHRDNYGNQHNYRMRAAGGRGSLRYATTTKNPLCNDLESLGLLGTDCFTKFIPEAYLRASAKQRLAILQGLMDTDGTFSGYPSFTSVSEKLALGVVEIVRSLGGMASIRKKNCFFTVKGKRKQGADAYHVYIRLKNPASCFRMKRKVDRAPKKYQYADCFRLAIVSVEPAGQKECRCIVLDNHDRLYVTDEYVVTHNSELLVVNAIASAMCGLKVFQIFDTATKRDTFIGGRMDPVIHSVDFYRKALKVADEKAGGEAIDAKRFKHFGDGSINCVGSESPQDFYSHRADVCQVDEHQLCNLDNLQRVFGRMSDSLWKFILRVGNPVFHGSADNRTIWYEFTQSDQRYWHVPCIHCLHPQILGWWSHFVDEIKSDTGAIIEISVRDKTWDPNSGRDPRPVCTNCGNLMVRLNPNSFWKPMAPAVKHHRGYQYSNLFSPTTRISGGESSLLSIYKGAMHDPRKMQKFVNDQLGLYYDFDGNSITEKMLEEASTGRPAGVPPYIFLNASDLAWRDLVGV